MNTSQKVLGIDIGTSHIKIVSIEKDKSKNKLLRYAMGPSNGLLAKILSTSNADDNSLSEQLKGFLKDNNFTEASDAVVVIPEQKVFSKVITMPTMSDKEFEQAVEWEAGQHLPQPLSEVYLKYSLQEEHSFGLQSGGSRKASQKNDYLGAAKNVVSSLHLNSAGQGSSDILLVSVPKIFIDRYFKIIKKSGLIPIGLEPTSLAIIRSISLSDYHVPTIIINMGDSSIDFYLTVKNNLRFVRSLSFGVSSMIKAISQELDISLIQASEYLYTYGFNEKALNGKIRTIVLPIINIIVDEFQKAQQYIQTRASFFGSESDHVVRQIIITGGGSLIPDIMIYLIEIVSMEVQMADPLKSLDISQVSNKSVLEQYGPLFSAAVGAALK